MSRYEARIVLNDPWATREEIRRTIYQLNMELRYIYQSMSDNAAQETRPDIKDTQELLEQLEFKLASLG